MVTQSDINNMSLRGREALGNGENLFLGWTKEKLIKEVNRIKTMNYPCPSVDLEAMANIPEDILRNVLLTQSSWHHVDGKPEWFYIVDEEWVTRMNSYDIENMIADAEMFEAIKNKPKLADFRIYIWKLSTTDHQYCKTAIRPGILFNDIAYFENGKYQVVCKDECEIEEIYVKAPRQRRTQFDNIRRKMRQYNIYC